MFGLGPTEVVIIFVIALLVLGPDKIPAAAAQLGKTIRQFRKMSQDVRTHIDEQGQLGQSFQDLQSALRGDLPSLQHLPTSHVNEQASISESTNKPRTVSTTEQIAVPQKDMETQTGGSDAVPSQG